MRKNTSLRKIFWITFVISILASIALPAYQDYTVGANKSDDSLAFILPIIAAVISALGLILTTYFSWRKDKRAQEAHDLSKKKTELEIERMEKQSKDEQ